MKCKVEIEMSNASFGVKPAMELALILIQAGRRLNEYGFTPNEKVNLLDSNGNIVGFYRIK